MTESLAVRRKRLIYRSRYRGSLESDVFFGRFADLYVDRLDERQLDRYEALLEENDQDLFAWISGRATVPARHVHDIFALLQRFQPARVLR